MVAYSCWFCTGFMRFSLMHRKIDSTLPLDEICGEVTFVAHAHLVRRASGTPTLIDIHLSPVRDAGMRRPTDLQSPSCSVRACIAVTKLPIIRRRTASLPSWSRFARLLESVIEHQKLASFLPGFSSLFSARSLENGATCVQLRSGPRWPTRRMASALSMIGRSIIFPSRAMAPRAAARVAAMTLSAHAISSLLGPKHSLTTAT